MADGGSDEGAKGTAQGGSGKWFRTYVPSKGMESVGHLGKPGPKARGADKHRAQTPPAPTRRAQRAQGGECQHVLDLVAGRAREFGRLGQQRHDQCESRGGEECRAERGGS